MGLLQTFSNFDTEALYISSTRHSRTGSTRLLLILSGAMTIFAAYLTSALASPESFMAFNFIFLAITIGFSAAYYIVNTTLYRNHPEIDCSVFVLASMCAAFLIYNLFMHAGIEKFALLNYIVWFLCGNFFIASVAFVANLKYFLITTSTQFFISFTLVYILSDSAQIQIQLIGTSSLFYIAGIFVNYEIERSSRLAFLSNILLDEEKKRTEDMLYNVLPQDVAQRIRDGEIVADSFPDLTVVFVDIVEFSKIAKMLTAPHTVKILNEFFLLADSLAEEHGVEKVKTIGDAYLAVSGRTASTAHGPQRAVEFALALVRGMMAIEQANGISLKVRVGIHSGPVVGGVIGSTRLAYDYWGHTVNVASRIQGAANPNEIAVTSAVYFMCKNDFSFYNPESLVLKGVGNWEVYRLRLED